MRLDLLKELTMDRCDNCLGNHPTRECPGLQFEEDKESKELREVMPKLMTEGIKELENIPHINCRCETSPQTNELENLSDELDQVLKKYGFRLTQARIEQEREILIERHIGSHSSFMRPSIYQITFEGSGVGRMINRATKEEEEQEEEFEIEDDLEDWPEDDEELDEDETEEDDGDL